MRYCANCVTPNTRPNITLDAEGVCNACRAHLSRPSINWSQRKAEFQNVVAQASARAAAYDCVIPVSGGKDSHWQVLQCLKAGLKPLCVTWRTPGRTALGERNLQNLIRLGVDHIDYSINPEVERRFMLHTFERCGSTAIPMHLALFAIPLRVAERFQIPLVVWGENSAFEYGAASEAHTGFRLTEEWLRVYGVTQGTTAADWVGETLTERDLAAYFRPTAQALEAQNIRAVFLGYYFPWDPEMTRAAAAAHGFCAREQGPRTGFYDFADIDDAFISLHHFLKWHKFGFTRLFDNLSLEIRNGRMTRAEAVRRIAEAGDQTPVDDIRRFCDFAGISPERFHNIADRFRNPALWRAEGGVWKMDGFLIENWSWA